ncbi:MAG: hypothetical protein IKN63_04345 [Bacilli bacterium]|nr:hypothetical protein [Bacilli bacterium]
MKFDINNFYIGKLTFVNEFNGLNILNTDDGQVKLKKKSIQNIIKGGAIPLDTKMNCYSVLTMFYKGSKGYICFHNLETYEDSNKNKDYVEQLIKIKDLLPKLGYQIPNRISVEYFYKLFNSFFKHNKQFKYNHELYKLDDFYIGSFDLLIKKDTDNQQLIPNLYYYYMFKNYGLNTIEKRIEIIENEIYESDKFKSIFYRLSDDTFYNVNNNQFYYLHNLNNIRIETLLKDILEDRNIIYNRKTISVPKVLKLQKEINRVL